MRLTPVLRSLALLSPLVGAAACGDAATAPSRVTAAAAPRYALGLASGGTYVLHNACSGRALDVKDASKADGARVQIWDSWKGANQQWQLTAVGDGSYQLTSVNSGKALDVFGQAAGDGAAVGQWAANGGANQHWKVTDLGTGYAKLNPMNAPAEALDVAGAGTAAGTAVQIWADHGTCAQQWQFEAVGATPTPAPGPSATRLIGIYTGAGGNAWNAGAGDDPDSWYRGFQLAEQGLGHPITALTHFPSWGGYSWWAFHVRETVRESRARRPGLVPLIALKLIAQGTDGVQWQDAGEMANVAAGGRDYVWTGVVDSLAALHVPVSIVRVGYEDNDTFMNDGYGYNATLQQNWHAAMTHVFTVMRAEAKARGVTVLLAVCPILNNSTAPVASVLPDPSLYDILGADLYNAYWGHGDVNDAATRRAYWANGEGGWGLDQHVALAKTLGKGVMFFEHGSTVNASGPAHGLADDSVFWNYSAQRIRDMRAQGVPYYGSAFWDVSPSDAPGAAFTQGQQPAVLAAVQQNFGTFVGDDLSGLIAGQAGGSSTAAVARTASRAIARGGHN